MKRISIFSIILALLLFPQLNGVKGKADNLTDTNVINNTQNSTNPELREFSNDDLVEIFKEFLDSVKVNYRSDVIQLIDELHIMISGPKQNSIISESQVEDLFKQGIDNISREYINIERKVEIQHGDFKQTLEISLVDHCIISHWWSMADYLLSKGAIINLKKFKSLLDEEMFQFCKEKGREAFLLSALEEIVNDEKNLKL